MQTLDLAEKACQGQMLELITKIQGTKKFYSIGTWGQCYNTFYDRKLPTFVIVPGEPFQPTLMFAGKAGAYLSGALLKGRLLGLTRKYYNRLEKLAIDK
jgi:hypothetical protein